MDRSVLGQLGLPQDRQANVTANPGIACFGCSPDAPAQSGRSHFRRLSDRLRAARKRGGQKLTPCERNIIIFTDAL